MTVPLVSILIPVYNVEPYIERCVRSVMEQTYENLEFVFVDDASDDLSIDILNRVLNDYTCRKKDVHIVHHEQRKGLAAARNTAVSTCQGDFVFHVDSDDWVEVNAVELLVKKQQDTNADIVSAEAYDYDGSIKTKHLSGGWNLDKETLLVNLLTYKVSTTMWRRLIRRSLYIENNITCDERGSGGEDFQVFPRLVYYANKVIGIKDCIYNYNKSNQNSITSTTRNNIDIQISGLISIKVIVAFFLDKESYLSNLVAGMDIKNIHYRMVDNAIQRNKRGYNVFLRYMKESDPKNWRLVHWDNPLVRFLESNYLSLLLVQKYRCLRVN